MRNKFGLYDLTVTIGEVLYQTLRELSECHWRHVNNNLAWPNLSYCARIVSEYSGDEKSFVDILNSQIEQEKENESAMRMNP